MDSYSARIFICRRQTKHRTEWRAVDIVTPDSNIRNVTSSESAWYGVVGWVLGEDGFLHKANEYFDKILGPVGPYSEETFEIAWKIAAQLEELERNEDKDAVYLEELETINLP